MENDLKEFKPDPVFLEAVEAGCKGDYGPITKFMEWEENIDLNEAFKLLLQDYRKIRTENEYRKFLSDYLIVQEVFNSEFDPKFDTSVEPRGGNTRSDNWPMVLEEYIEEMDDCTFETIQAELGFLFGLKTSESRQDIRRRERDVKAYLKPATEAEIQHVAQAYLLPIIESCVRAGHESLPELVGMSNDTPLVMKGIEGLMKPGTGTTLELDNSHYQNAKRMGIPDWSIYLLLKGEQKRYVTIGETKMDSKWSSAWLPRQLGSGFIDDETHWPLRQQAKYCRDGNTSWSFLYTPKEVVLCRFYIVPSDDLQSTNPSFGLKWKSIPLREDGSPKSIGPIMGIWSWIIFAFLDQNRGLCTRDQLCRLSDIVPKQSDSQQQDILGEALQVAEEGLTAVEDSGVIEVATPIKTVKTPKKPRKGPKQTQPRSTVWEGRLRPRKAKVVVGVGLVR